MRSPALTAKQPERNPRRGGVRSGRIQHDLAKQMHPARLRTPLAAKFSWANPTSDTTVGPLLFGRDEELARIDELIAHVRLGHGAVATVEGPAGIGKTALLAEAARRALCAGFCVLRAAGAQLEREYTFGVVRQLFTPVVAGARTPGELLEGAAGLAAGPLGLGGASAEAAARCGDPASSAMHGLYWLTANVAAQLPVLVVLDDAHCADSISLRFLLYLVRRLARVPVLVIVAARAAGAQGNRELLAQLGVLPGVAVLSPALLSEAQAARMVADRGFCGALAEFVAASHHASGGNPFLLGELLSALRDDGASGSAADAARVAGCAPQGVVRWVLARLGALGEHAQRLAFAFAVLGAGAELSDAAVLAELGPSAAAAAADALIEADILTAERPYAFVHPLLHAAVCAGLPPAKRADTHARAASMTAERGAPLAQVAGHLLAAGPACDGWAVEVLRGAAREASVGGAPASAASYLERALHETPAHGVRADLLVELGEAQLQAGLPGAARRLREALELHGDPGRRAETCLALGRALFCTGDLAAARDSFRRGMAELGDRDDELPLELVARYIAVDHDPQLPSVAGARVRALLAGETPGRTRTERILLAQLAYRAARSGEQPPDQVARLARRALDDGALLGDCSRDIGPYGAACHALLLSGEADAAIAGLNRGIESSQHCGSRVASGWFSLLRGIAHYTHGDLVAAMADLDVTSNAFDDEYALDLPATRAFRALCLIERDEIASAADALALPGDEDRWVAQPSSFISYLYALGRLRAAQGRPAAALDTLLECEKPVRQTNALNPAANLSWRSEAALLAARIGDQDRARELVAQDIKLARECGAPHALAVALRAAGLIEGSSSGRERLAQAVKMLDGSGMNLELARSLTEYGAALRRAGHRRDAREPLRRGLDLATRCGALALAKRAREELVAAGARPRRERIWGAEALTASELRVARMAAHGMTNRQIAEALFITRKTTTVHLTRIYQKLDIEARAQLWDALGELRDAEPKPSL
jgi:DNA-binding NarL/FixJ family response regulator